MDFFEIDFIKIDSDESGDAIALRYQLNNTTRFHVVDGGFQDTGEKVIEHINTYYNKPESIDSVILTHPDGDHAGGLKYILENINVRELWMLRPWQYSEELIDKFGISNKPWGAASVTHTI